MGNNGFKYYKELVGSNAEEFEADDDEADDEDDAGGHIPYNHLYALLGR